MYRVSAYFLAKVATEFPLSLGIPTLLVTSSYFLIEFNTNLAYKFPLAIMILTCGFNCFSGIGYILGVGISDPVLIAVLSPILIVP